MIEEKKSKRWKNLLGKIDNFVSTVLRSVFHSFVKIWLINLQNAEAAVRKCS